MTPCTSRSVPSTANFAAASLSAIQDLVNGNKTPTSEAALQAVLAAEKVVMLARDQRDTCRTRSKLAAYDVKQARSKTKVESSGNNNERSEEVQLAGHPAKKRAKPEKQTPARSQPRPRRGAQPIAPESGQEDGAGQGEAEHQPEQDEARQDREGSQEHTEEVGNQS